MYKTIDQRRERDEIWLLVLEGCHLDITVWQVCQYQHYQSKQNILFTPWNEKMSKKRVANGFLLAWDNAPTALTEKWIQ